jgi:hypothetical protein
MLEVRPTLPAVPDVIPFEGESGKRVLCEWAENYAQDTASRLRYPDTTGG